MPPPSLFISITWTAGLRGSCWEQENLGARGVFSPRWLRVRDHGGNRVHEGLKRHLQEVSKRESDKGTQEQFGETEGARAIQNFLWLFQVRPLV